MDYDGLDLFSYNYILFIGEALMPRMCLIHIRQEVVGDDITN